jgi:hypothetical protein
MLAILAERLPNLRSTDPDRPELEALIHRLHATLETMSAINPPPPPAELLYQEPC